MALTPAVGPCYKANLAVKYDSSSVLSTVLLEGNCSFKARATAWSSNLGICCPLFAVTRLTVVKGSELATLKFRG